MSIPTNADVAKLLNAAEPPNRPKSRPGFTAFVALCAFAGLRRGEALGVQVGDIDFLARTLRVKRQIQRAKAADVAAGKDLVEAVAGITVMTRPPKYESERTIYLPDELVAILAEHVRQHTPTGDPGRWLFSEDGRPWHDNLVDYRWRSTRTDAGRDLQAPRTAPLLRQRPHRRRVRRRHRSARDGPRLGHHDAQHLRPPLADRRGQDPRRGVRHGRGSRRGVFATRGALGGQDSSEVRMSLAQGLSRRVTEQPRRPHVRRRATGTPRFLESGQGSRTPPSTARAQHPVGYPTARSRPSQVSEGG